MIEKKTIFLKPKFALGERVYVQSYGLNLLTDSRDRPDTMTVRGYVYVCEFSRGYSDNSVPVKGTEELKYITSWSHNNFFDENKLFKTVEDFNEATLDERSAKQAEENMKKEDKANKDYQEAKMLVARYEASKMILAMPELTN
jgi:hypothetical protein